MVHTRIILCVLIVSIVGVQCFNHTDDWWPWPWKDYDNGPPCPLRENKILSHVNANSPNVGKAISTIRDVLAPAMSKSINNSVHLDAAISWGIVYNGEILATGNSGVTNRRTGELPTNNTVYGVGSVTKIFTTFAFMQAIERELASLDDPITKFFNEQNPPVFSINNPYSARGAEAVTLHSLATHTSGLPRKAYCGLYQYSAPGNCTDEDNFKVLSQLNLMANPFKQPHYSNLGISLLGRGLERVWNTTYEQYLQENVFNPLGMNSTGFAPLPKQILQNTAQGYNVVGNQSVPYTEMNVPFGFCAPAGGLYISVLDAMKFLNFTLSRPYNSSILSQDILLKYLMPGINFPDGINGFGLATWEPFYQMKRWVITKGGSVPGYGAIIALVPDLNLGLCAFTNIQGGPAMAKLGAQMANVLIEAIDKDLDAVPQSVPEPPNFEQYLGVYGNGLFSIQAGPNGTYIGFLSGTEYHFLYEPDQNIETTIAMRYTAAKRESCFGRYASGSGALAYFFKSLRGPAVSFPDENYSFYNLHQSGSTDQPQQKSGL